jgi:hypothetical protein
LPVSLSQSNYFINLKFICTASTTPFFIATFSLFRPATNQQNDRYCSSGHKPKEMPWLFQRRLLSKGRDKWVYHKRIEFTDNLGYANQGTSPVDCLDWHPVYGSPSRGGTRYTSSPSSKHWREKGTGWRNKFGCIAVPDVQPRSSNCEWSQHWRSCNNSSNDHCEFGRIRFQVLWFPK